MKNIISVSILVFIVSNVICEYKNYGDFKVFKIIPQTAEDLKVLQELKNDVVYDFWTEAFHIGHTVRVMVPPEKQDEFIKYMTSVGISTDVSINNVQT